MPAIARILARYDRQRLEGFISIAIDLLDVVDGDPDLEIEDPAGETVPVVDDLSLPPEEDDADPDLEETDAEDSFVLSTNALRLNHGAGCNVGDPDCAVDDNGCDDLDQDKEPDETIHADFPIDQSSGPLSPDLAEDRGIRQPYIDRARRDTCRTLPRADRLGRTHVMTGGRDDLFNKA